MLGQFDTREEAIKNIPRNATRLERVLDKQKQNKQRNLDRSDAARCR